MEVGDDMASIRGRTVRSDVQSDIKLWSKLSPGLLNSEVSEAAMRVRLVCARSLRGRCPGQFLTVDGNFSEHHDCHGGAL